MSVNAVVSSRSKLGMSVAALMALSCSRSPPPSRFPNAEIALERMRASQACSVAVSGEASLDYFGEGGRVKGNLLYLAASPERVRLDVFSPFGATLSTLTSDGQRFNWLDLRNKRFVRGPANTCNLQSFTQVPLPPHAFVQLLRGEAPVLRHEPSATSIDWSGGSYAIRIHGAHQAEQEIRLIPTDADYTLPFDRQRVRVLSVKVTQANVPLYEVQLSGHEAAATATARVDPEGIDPPVPPSGPACRAELPRRIHFIVGDAEHDLVLDNKEIQHNPPLQNGVFAVQPVAGVAVQRSPCGE